MLNNKNKTSSLIIKNNSNEIKEYEIVLVYYKMQNNGKLVIDANEADDTATSFIKFAPRKIKLTPGEEQVVRVIFKPFGELSNRDYRCHIQFNPVNTEIKLNDEQNKKITFELKPKIGVAVPIFINNFSGDRKAEIKNVKLNKKDMRSILSFELNNLTPSTFLIGDISVVDRDEKIVAQLNGINSYLNLLPLDISLDANLIPNVDKKYFLVFKSAEVFGSKELARVEIK